MSSSLIACPHCYQQVPDDQFCESCGRRLHQIECRGCGASTLPGALFCDKCGLLIESPNAVGLPPAEAWMEPTPVDRFGNPLNTQASQPVPNQTAAVPPPPPVGASPVEQGAGHPPTPVPGVPLWLPPPASSQPPIAPGGGYQWGQPRPNPVLPPWEAIQANPGWTGAPVPPPGFPGHQVMPTYQPGQPLYPGMAYPPGFGYPLSPYGPVANTKVSSARIWAPVLLESACVSLVAILFITGNEHAWNALIVTLTAMLAVHVWITLWALIAHGGRWGGRVFLRGWVGLKELTEAIRRGEAKPSRPLTWPVIPVMIVVLALVGDLGLSPEIGQTEADAATEANVVEAEPTEAFSDEALFNPLTIGADLQETGLVPEEKPLGGECLVEVLEYFVETDAVSMVGQFCRYGSIEYWVFTSDDEADDYVRFQRTDDDRLEAFPDYQTDAFVDDIGVHVQMVAVGNVVVIGYADPDYLDLAPPVAEQRNSADTAAALATIGVERLLRVAEDRSPNSSTV